jgi:hypothetical protein
MTILEIYEHTRSLIERGDNELPLISPAGYAAELGEPEWKVRVAGMLIDEHYGHDPGGQYGHLVPVADDRFVIVMCGECRNLAPAWELLRDGTRQRLRCLRCGHDAPEGPTLTDAWYKFNYSEKE